MIIKTIWEKLIPLNELHISVNPENKEKVERIISTIEKSETISLIHPLNNRVVQVDLNEIVSIESFTQSSIVKVMGGEQEFYINKRLKELDYLNRYGLFRISNSVMINIRNVVSFQVINNARLDVVTKDNCSYIVSRHYAKKIKEELLCSHI